MFTQAVGSGHLWCYFKFCRQNLKFCQILSSVTTYIYIIEGVLGSTLSDYPWLVQMRDMWGFLLEKTNPVWGYIQRLYQVSIFCTLFFLRNRPNKILPPPTDRLITQSKMVHKRILYSVIKSWWLTEAYKGHVEKTT